MTVEATLPVQIEEAGKVDATPSSPTTSSDSTAALLAPTAPTDAQVTAAHGHNVSELVHEMHGERAIWESHPVLASSPLWAGKLLAKVHGSTIARLIAAMGNDPYLAYNQDAWTALDHLLRGNESAAHELMNKSGELGPKLRALLARLGTSSKTVAAVLLRSHTAAPTAKPQTQTESPRAPLQMLMEHVKDQGTVPRRTELPQSARRVFLRRPTQAPTLRNNPTATVPQGARGTATLATPSTVKAYLIAQRAAYVALAHAQLTKDEVGKYRGPKQRRLIKKVKRKGDAHPRTRRDGAESELEER